MIQEMYECSEAIENHENELEGDEHFNAFSLISLQAFANTEYFQTPISAVCTDSGGRPRGRNE